MSQRHTPTTEDDPLLDAARACVLAVGVRRTTVTDVARRAGVSRMTLYRRYPDLEGVLASLMTREFGRLVADARRGRRREHARAGGGFGRARLARAGRDPLFVRLLDVDPELLLPYVTQRLGGMQKMAVEAGALSLAVADGSVRTDASPEVLSAAVELIARGFVLASHGELELDPWAELARAIDGYLRP